MSLSPSVIAAIVATAANAFLGIIAWMLQQIWSQVKAGNNTGSQRHGEIQESLEEIQEDLEALKSEVDSNSLILSRIESRVDGQSERLYEHNNRLTRLESNHGRATG